MSGLYKAALALVIVGALNWMLVGLFNFNLVGAIFGGDMSILSRIIYTVVGICGLICIGIFNRRLHATATTHEMRDRDVRRVA